jgi:hypothetical protein
MEKEKVYIGAKLIRACPMNRLDFLARTGGIGIPGDSLREGYCVKYPDGYTSWSPRATFEEAYRLVSDAEKKLIF